MRFLFVFFFAVAIAGAEPRHCYFTPPSGWEIAHLKVPSPHVKIGFIGKGSTEFRPSINLALEEVDVSLKEYVKAVKELQLADPTTKWRDLGPFSMQGGAGRLTEMSNSSPWGTIKIFQAFLVADETAYILTAAVLKKDLPQFQVDLLNSFRSLTLTDDLWSPISDPAQREALQTRFALLETEEEWKPFQSSVESVTQLGPYWQFLALQAGLSKIHQK